MASGDTTGTSATISLKDCAVFDGVDDYVSVDNAAIAELNDHQSWSFDVLMPTLTGVANAAFISTRNSGAFFYIGESGSTGRLKIRLNDGTNNVENTLIFLTETNWNNVTIVIDEFVAGGCRIYINGVLNKIVDLSTLTTLLNGNALEFGRQDIINILEKYYSVKLKNVTMSYFGIKS